MCRLFYAAGNSKLDKDATLALLDYLVAQNGGHGCGHAIASGHKILTCKKAVELEPSEQINEIVKQVARGNDALWHTRLASVGVICDRLCHPFHVNGTRFSGVVAHNGTWWRGSQIARRLDEMHGRDHSDSEVFARNIADLDRKTLDQFGGWPDSGVWFVIGNDQHGKLVRRLLHYSGSIMRCTVTGIIASSFPSWWDHDVQTIGIGEFILPSAFKSRAKVQA